MSETHGDLCPLRNGGTGRCNCSLYPEAPWSIRGVPPAGVLRDLLDRYYCDHAWYYGDDARTCGKCRAVETRTPWTETETDRREARYATIEECARICAESGLSEHAARIRALRVRPPPTTLEAAVATHSPLANYLLAFLADRNRGAWLAAMSLSPEDREHLVSELCWILAHGGKPPNWVNE